MFSLRKLPPWFANYTHLCFQWDSILGEHKRAVLKVHCKMWYFRVKQCAPRNGQIIKTWLRGTAFKSLSKFLAHDRLCCYLSRCSPAISHCILYNNIAPDHIKPTEKTHDNSSLCCIILPRSSLALFDGPSHRCQALAFYSAPSARVWISAAWSSFKGSNDCHSHMEWCFCLRQLSGVGLKASQSFPLSHRSHDFFVRHV